MYKICDCCGKKFYIGWEIHLADYKYRQLVANQKEHRKAKDKKDAYEYYCSYTCWRKSVPEGTRRYKRL